jgi:hypothetical protein
MSLAKLIEKILRDDIECGKASTNDLLTLCEAAEVMNEGLSRIKYTYSTPAGSDADVILTDADLICKGASGE